MPDVDTSAQLAPIPTDAPGERTTLPVEIPSIRPSNTTASFVAPSPSPLASAGIEATESDAAPPGPSHERPTLPCAIQPPPRARRTDSTEDTLRLHAVTVPPEPTNADPPMRRAIVVGTLAMTFVAIAFAAWTAVRARAQHGRSTADVASLIVAD